MRTKPLIHLAIVLAAGALFPIFLQAEGGDLDALKLQRDVFLEEFEKPLKSLNEKYETGLKELKAKAQEKGDLDQALAITKEIENHIGTDREPSKAYSDLARLQEIYRTESGKLIAKRHESRLAIMTKYDASLQELETQMTRQGKLDEALAIRNEREAAGKLLIELERGKPQASGVILLEEFDAPLDPAAWKWTHDVQFGDGFCFANSWDGQTRLEMIHKISGDFRIEIDFVRDGEHVWVNWDCSLKLSDATPVAAFLLARNDTNHVYVDTTPEPGGKPGDPNEPGSIKVTQRARKTQNATLVVTHQDGKFSAALIDPKGRTIETKPIEIPAFEATGFVFRFAGTADTPRKITRIAITRP